MPFKLPTYLLRCCCLLAGVLAIPLLTSRHPTPCFIVGDNPLPPELQAAVYDLANRITCDRSRRTVGNVPDVESSTASFSWKNYAKSDSSPLQFALDTFYTERPISRASLTSFQNWLDMYMATEAGIVSEQGNLGIRIPRSFLQLQVARIKSAKGIDITDPSQTVEKLIEEVLENSKWEDDRLKDRVKDMGMQLEKELHFSDVDSMMQELKRGAL